MDGLAWMPPWRRRRPRLRLGNICAYMATRHMNGAHHTPALAHTHIHSGSFTARTHLPATPFMPPPPRLLGRIARAVLCRAVVQAAAGAQDVSGCKDAARILPIALRIPSSPKVFSHRLVCVSSHRRALRACVCACVCARARIHITSPPPDAPLYRQSRVGRRRLGP